MHELFGPPGPVNQLPPYQRTREMSLTDMLLENRIIFLAGPIHERTASIVIQQMLYLQSVRRNQDVNLYINSPGGLVDQTLAIYDTMQFMGCELMYRSTPPSLRSPGSPTSVSIESATN